MYFMSVNLTCVVNKLRLDIEFSWKHQREFFAAGMCRIQWLYQTRDHLSFRIIISYF